MLTSKYSIFLCFPYTYPTKEYAKELAELYRKDGYTVKWHDDIMVHVITGDSTGWWRLTEPARIVQTLDELAYPTENNNGSSN